MNPAVVASQIAVKTGSGGSINAGIWPLVGVIVLALCSVVVAYIRKRPEKTIAESVVDTVSSKARAADFERLRDEIDRLNERIEKLEGLAERAGKAAEEATRHSMRSDTKLEAALGACEVLLVLVKREMPSAPEIMLAERLLARAATDDGGIAEAMRNLSLIRGVGE